MKITLRTKEIVIKEIEPLKGFNCSSNCTHIGEGIYGE